jgi:hypothetical protein
LETPLIYPRSVYSKALNEGICIFNITHRIQQENTIKYAAFTEGLEDFNEPLLVL